MKMRIDFKTIQRAYEIAFEVKWWHTLVGLAHFEFDDEEYVAPELEEIEKVLAADQGDKEQYVANDFDCDDFSYALMGAFHKNRMTAAMPIFITKVLTPQGGHALISFYHKDTVTLIEPQTDQLFEVPPGWALMSLTG